MTSLRLFVLAILLALLASPPGSAWGMRAHTWINRVAVQAIPGDGPTFLKAHEEWIGYLSVVPDSWRRPSEPFVKILEDPNHGWFKEQFAFMTEIPRSRYEFVLKLADEQQRLAATGDPAAALTNVRWTGTLPYAAVEGYERMLTAMRGYRQVKSRGEDTRHVELEIAFYMGWTGHYTGDGAQPLHDTIHHDGWQGPNPRSYTTDPRVHGRFESQFVDAMQLEAKDLLPRMTPARVLPDPFSAVLAHLDEAASHVEQVYQLDQRGALADGTNPEARALVSEQAARAAALLRDLAYTAWIESGKPPAGDPAGNPITPAHPRYNPRTGSAPAPESRRTSEPRGEAAGAWRPLSFGDPVLGKNFYLFDAFARHPEVLSAIASDTALSDLRTARVSALVRAADHCGTDTRCHAEAFKWSAADMAVAERRLRALVASNAAAGLLVAKDLRPSGMMHGLADGTDADLVAGAWHEAIVGLNRIIDVYATGAEPLYPKIDSVSYDPASDGYRRLVQIMVSVMREQQDSLTVFYAPTLDFARRLLDANRRDEAGRFEPLHDGENAAARRRVAAVEWSNYEYAAIVVPGAGPDRPDVALDPWAKLRLELAVLRWRQGRAPFLIVSGGYVHPNQTPFNEALEMKRALVRDFRVPPEAILIDPHARHTTTNLRNASRLVLRYGLPADQKLLITTDQSQSAYISGQEFHDRCLRELGYQPGIVGKRLSPFDLEFVVSAASLHADSRDPLDP